MPQRTPPPAADRENLAGLVERVTFHNEDSGFCVLRVKARGQRDLITVIGHAAAIGAGEFVQASGRWINDRTHGVQFRADFLRAAPPTMSTGFEYWVLRSFVCTSFGWFFLSLAALCGGEHAAAEKIEAGPAVHVALDELETVDVPFDRPGAPRFAQGGMDSVIILSEADGEASEGAAFSLVDPGVQPIGQALLDHLRVAADETCSVCD